MKHTKEPWDSGTHKTLQPRSTFPQNGEQPPTNCKIIPIADYERAMLCVNKCKGLTDEALEKNLVDRGVRYLWDEYEEASCCLDDDMETSVWEDES